MILLKNKNNLTFSLCDRVGNESDLPLNHGGNYSPLKQGRNCPTRYNLFFDPVKITKEK